MFSLVGTMYLFWSNYEHKEGNPSGQSAYCMAKMSVPRDNCGNKNHYILGFANPQAIFLLFAVLTLCSLESPPANGNSVNMSLYFATWIIAE